MLFNLGWTADAAAAHENDLVTTPAESRHPSPVPHPSSSISIPTLSSLGLGELYTLYRGPESNKPHRPPLRRMSLTPVDSLSSNDDDHSIAAPALSRNRATRSQSIRKPLPRPKTTYQLAHPASHARHRRLKFRPKLLLQLQRVSQSTRPLPILDVLPSTVFLPRLARKFPTIFRGKKGLGPNDLIIVMCDLYERTPGDIPSKYLGPNDEEQEHREVVATICQTVKEDGALSQGKAEICLINGPVWEATPLANGSYEFKANTSQGVQVLRWVSRGGKSRRVSAPPGSLLPEDTKRLTFSVIDPNTRRHPVIATMTRNVLEIYDEYSTPSPQGDLPTTPTCGMSVVSDSSELDSSMDRDVVKTHDELRAIIIVTSIWVAFREGWSQNFSYDDTESVPVNHKAISSPAPSRQGSPTAMRRADEVLSEDRDKYSEGLSLNSIRNRLSGSTTFPSQSSISSQWARSAKYASLPRRSKSTGAAFIERSNRRSASAAENPPHRHSMLPIAQESDRVEAEASFPSQEMSSQQFNPRNTGKLDRAIDKSTVSNGRSQKQPTAPTEKSSKQFASQGIDPPVPSKQKRRHRLSSFFDFFTKKSGHH